MLCTRPGLIDTLQQASRQLLVPSSRQLLSPPSPTSGQSHSISFLFRTGVISLVFHSRLPSPFARASWRSPSPPPMFKTHAPSPSMGRFQLRRVQTTGSTERFVSEDGRFHGMPRRPLNY